MLLMNVSEPSAGVYATLSPFAFQNQSCSRQRGGLTGWIGMTAAELGLKAQMLPSLLRSVAI